MAQKRVYLIRHGKTPGNVQRRFLGRGTDEGLSEEGMKEAKRCRRLIDSMQDFTRGALRVCASPMIRALQTAGILFDCPVTAVRALEEIDFGLFEGKEEKELSKMPSWQSWVDGGCLGQVPGGENLDDFIEDFAPDLVFSFVKALPQYYQTICYLREKFGIPLLTWIADDEYTGYLRRGRTERIERLRRELDESAVVKGCSQEICDYYNAVFGCHATPLYKGCDLSTPIKERVNDPVRIVYAGNLLFGRLDVLRAVSDALEHCAAASGKAVCFDIYSSTPLSDPEIETYFGRNPCTVFKGAAPYAEIKTRLSEADIVLLAESFEDEEILKTRYSFSTKIIDYLQSGSVILAVGPECLASIRYLRRIPGTFVIDQMESIQTMLPELLNDADHFSRRAAETRAFAAAHHDAKTLAAQLYQLLQTLETDQRTQP